MEVHGTTIEESQTMNAICKMAKDVGRIANAMEEYLHQGTETIGSKARQSNEALADFILSLEPGTENISQVYSVIKGVDFDDCPDLSSRQMLLEILETKASET